MVKELSVSQKLSTQVLQQFKTESEKKLLLQQYITGKLVSELMREKYLTLTETPINEGKDLLIEAKIKVAK